MLALICEIINFLHFICQKVFEVKPNGIQWGSCLDVHVQNPSAHDVCLFV
jgi:hypothetical protein